MSYRSNISNLHDACARTNQTAVSESDDQMERNLIQTASQIELQIKFNRTKLHTKFKSNLPETGSK